MKKIILFYLFIFFNLGFCQNIEFGLSFYPYSINNSSSVIKYEDNYIYEIFSYFAQASKIEEDNSKNNIIKINSSIIDFDEFKKLFSGFTKSEIIRLILIAKKVDNLVFKDLINLRKKGKTFHEISLTYNIDYLNDIFLNSQKIYDEIFKEYK